MPPNDPLYDVLARFDGELDRSLAVVAGEHEQHLPPDGGATLTLNDIDAAPAGDGTTLFGQVAIAWHQPDGWQEAAGRLFEHLAGLWIEDCTVSGFGVHATPNEDGDGYCLCGSVQMRCSVPYVVPAG